MKLTIDQIALCPADPEQAIELLTAMGLKEWARDHVVALGHVQPLELNPVRNEADLAFNYEAFAEKRELEVLHYTAGANWMEGRTGVSHLGMHCSAADLEGWKAFFAERGFAVAQEVNTWSHTNPEIAGKRWYHYCIFHTRSILGVDLKFIVRRNAA